MTYSDRMKLASEAALKSGAMLLNYQDLHVDKKAENDYVTNADKASEALIRDFLLTACPEDGFFGEEGGVTGGEGKGMWVVDPIDGTTNFIRGIPPYTISIAYVYDGQPVAGAVYAPLTGELFTACLGGGAFLNGKPIHVSGATDPHDCILCLSFAHRVPQAAQRMYRLLPKVAPQINDVRRLGSAAYDLCCVASGRADAYCELCLNLYDIAAGVLLVREAGGLTSGWPEEEDCLVTGNVVAASPALMPWLMSELA